MDFIKKAASDFSSKSGSSSNSGEQNQQQQQQGSSNTSTGNTDNAGSAQTQDYGDKAFGFASKKAGYNLDPTTSEKITDGIRGAYEKTTGNKVDPKYSN